jgi:hypothetical protein
VIATEAPTSVYLDVCTLCRPYDDQNLMRIRLETDAFYLILQHIHNGRYTMIVSPVHFREVAAIDESRERIEVTALLHRYGTTPSCDLSAVRQRAEALHARSLALPMVRMWPLRKPQPTCSLRVMIDCSGNVGALRCACGP